jgi:hypothetical protein
LNNAVGKLLTNADLDVCHGRAEKVAIDGRTYDYLITHNEQPALQAVYIGNTGTSMRVTS